ncbi:MAG: hypothetical protein JWQ43_19 [Glaciihabitans sp.]|nr:hypothetical protein [Glaciihabitans sp.]
MPVDLLPDLRVAVARGQIEAYFQPMVDVSTRRIVAVEALARWKHPEHGLIAPNVFIPLAEEHGLIGEIGAFMIAEGCRCAAAWNGGSARVQVSVNVSAAQLTTSSLLDQITDNLRRLSVPDDVLVVEITESLPVVEIAEVNALLNEMRLLGVGVSVDDYGTGHSTAEQLAGLPTTEVKIDMSRVQAATPNDPFIRGVVTLAHARGITVVAEGVETEAQLDIVRGLGVDRAQGYLFGRPESESDISRLLKNTP